IISSLLHSLRGAARDLARNRIRRNDFLPFLKPRFHRNGLEARNRIRRHYPSLIRPKSLQTFSILDRHQKPSPGFREIGRVQLEIHPPSPNRRLQNLLTRESDTTVGVARILCKGCNFFKSKYILYEKLLIICTDSTSFILE
ncbi:unnamed protein product, partial [Linum tenue]